jgi:hypothetical protein
MAAFCSLFFNCLDFFRILSRFIQNFIYKVSSNDESKTEASKCCVVCLRVLQIQSSVGFVRPKKGEEGAFF